MGLIKCPDCGKEFSDRISACPNCACPIEEATEHARDDLVEGNKSTISFTTTIHAQKNKSKKIIPIIIIIAVIAIIASVFLLRKSTSFSEDTNAIAKAEESVVMIYCYDYDGEESATGSGFVAYDGQTIITNYHVMEDAYTCKISTNQDKTYTADKILCYSKENDIAIISVSEETDLEPLKLGDSDKIKKGENVVAIGSPLGIKNTVSQGILSGRLMDDNMDILQFTASISSGSSGGALFNDDGEIVGISFASIENGQNLNLAVPINNAKALYESKSSKMDISEIYMENHPYLTYVPVERVDGFFGDTIDKELEVFDATMNDLRENPAYYNGKTIRIPVYVSSISDNQNFAYITDNIDNISGDWLVDFNETSDVDFQDAPCVSMDPWFKYDGKCIDLYPGDAIMLIGDFTYHYKGEPFPPEDIDEYTRVFAWTHEYAIIEARKVFLLE